MFSLPTEFLNPALLVSIPQQDRGSVNNIIIENPGSLTSFSADDINPFIGGSTIAVSNSLNNLTSVLTVIGGQGNFDATSTGNLGGQLIIQYNFLDPIPEPGTWAMLISGFGLTGASMRRRRRAQHSRKAIAA